MEIIWQAHKIDAVVQAFAKGFTPSNSTHISKYDYWIDPKKGEILFRLFVENDSSEKNN